MISSSLVLIACLSQFTLRQTAVHAQSCSVLD